MAKSSNQKLKLMYLMKILLEYTDETHSLTMEEIKTKLKLYDISAERKSLYNDIESLRLYGLDIIGTKEDRTSTVIFFSQFSRRFSASSAIFIRSIFVLPQVGQETNLTPPVRSPSAFKSRLPVSTSRTGSSVKETRIVSPIPRKSSPPIPAADFTVPFAAVPASVTPKCSG